MFRMASKLVVLAMTLSVTAYSQDARTTWDNPCAGKKVQPNLELTAKQHLTGNLKQLNGVPLAQSRISLQKFRDKDKQTSTIFKEVVTDDKGRFDFGLVSPGKYRFLPTPRKIFNETKNESCVEGETCELNLVLLENPSDQGLSSCSVE